MAAAEVVIYQNGDSELNQEIAAINHEDIFEQLRSDGANHSAIFFHNLEIVYGAPKKTIIAKLKELDLEILKTFREQLFYIFLDHFGESTIKENGFIITEEDISVQLKTRKITCNHIFRHPQHRSKHSRESNH